MFECGLQGFNFRSVKRVSNVMESRNSSHNVGNDPIGSVVTTVEMETASQPPCDVSNPDEQQQQVMQGHHGGSVPSHSSHMSYNVRQRSDKGTPTSTEQHPDAGTHHCQKNCGQMQSKAEKDLSSCSHQIQAVWLSFAALPRTSPAKKSEVALLDRNLLSTASPAINAWMNSGDRLAVTLMQLIGATEIQSLSVLDSWQSSSR